MQAVVPLPAQKQLIQQQGLIQENAYEQQAVSYTAMAKAADLAGQAADQAASGSLLAAGIKGAAAIATIVLK